MRNSDEVNILMVMVEMAKAEMLYSGLLETPNGLEGFGAASLGPPVRRYYPMKDEFVISHAFTWWYIPYVARLVLSGSCTSDDLEIMGQFAKENRVTDWESAKYFVNNLPIVNQ